MRGQPGSGAEIRGSEEDTEVSRPIRANFRSIEMFLFPLQIIFIDSYVTTTTYK